MKFIDLTCSKCGATLQVNSDLKKCMCQYCGNGMLIDDEIIHHKLDNGFEFGYQTQLGRQKFKEQLSEIDDKIAKVKQNIGLYTSKSVAHLFVVIILVVLLIICNVIAGGMN